jgi:ABC-type polysaccharide/polyol phosphate transport system ATPase subunit
MLGPISILVVVLGVLADKDVDGILAALEPVFDSIVVFAGIGEYINEPLRAYSSGMSLRLAFSVAINVDPDILIVDEVLAVGDTEFQAQCLERIRDFRRRGFAERRCRKHAGGVP